MESGSVNNLVYFGHNRNDVALIRRIRTFLDSELAVTGFTFRRDGESVESPVEWTNIDLGYVEHAKFGQRLLVLTKSLTRILRHRAIIKQADVIYARNLDIYLLAWFARMLVPFKKPVMVYECLDVHGSLTGSSQGARILRWLERRILDHCDLLIVSSPGFIKNYFDPVQQYTGNCFLVENKLHVDTAKIKRPKVSDITLTNNRPLKLVWPGILRCTKTLGLMKALAESMGDEIEIHFWGLISGFLIADFEEQIEKTPNIVLHGQYAWPDELEKVYRNSDLVWSQELSWRGYNSDWLLPNRIYEGSYFGVLSLAVEGTETAEYVKNEDIGYVLADANHETVITFFRSLDKQELYEKRQRLITMESEKFVVSEKDALELLLAISMCRETSIKSCV